MEDRNIAGYAFGGLGVILSGVNPDQILSVTLSILSVISILVSLAFSLYRWYHLAKKDGKISKDEIDDLNKIIDDSMTQAKDTVRKEAQSGKDRPREDD